MHPGKKGDFFIHARVISRKFCGKFLDFMQQAYNKEHLICKGKISNLMAKKHFRILKDRLYTKEWVVNIQAPFGSPEKVLEYLSRYVFRIAIINRRIIEVRDGKVLFTWKDYRRNGSFRKMKLDIDEPERSGARRSQFIRRFMLHILPKGFFKVRYYGIFASRHRKAGIEKYKELLESEKKHEGYDKKTGVIWPE